MRHRKTHQIPGVIVQERGDIDPLMASQQERKKIRLPQLVRLGPLEVLHLLLAPHPLRCRLRLDTFGSQHSPHRRLRGADPQEAPHHIADATAPGSRFGLLRRQDRLRPLIGRLFEVRMRCRLAHLERIFSALPVRLHPLDRSRVRHA